VNALSQLLDLPESEKKTRGLVHTPAEIAQQPDTWQSTFDFFKRRRAEIWDFLASAGLAVDPASDRRFSSSAPGPPTTLGIPSLICFAKRKAFRSWSELISAGPTFIIL